MKGVFVLTLTGIFFVLIGFFQVQKGEDETPERRIARARKQWGQVTQRRCQELKVTFPPQRVLFRAYKSERQLELWIGNEAGPLKLYKTFPVAAASGTIGPKRKEGDKQVPEGVYFIDRFNPRSSYYLSLGLNYPNTYARAVGDPKQPGSDIFIHGSNVSIGCLAMTDDGIREIYPLALDAKSAGQTRIPVLIFPCKMTRENLERINREYPQWTELWKQLAAVDAEFTRTKLPPLVEVSKKGYSLK